MLNFKGAKRRYKPTASLKKPSNFQLRLRKGATAAKRVREKCYRTFFHMFFEVERTLINGDLVIPRGSVYKIYTDMKTKYVQKVIPSASTKAYRNLTTRELRKKAIAEFDKHCRGKIPRNLHTGIPIRLDSDRKTARGEAIYSKKVAVIPKICELLKHACYSNWGARKDQDAKTVIGYYNFKAYIYIDDKKECVRLAVRAMSNGAFYYSVEVNKKP